MKSQQRTEVMNIITGLPNIIKGLMIGVGGSFQKLVTGRSERKIGFRLKKYTIYDGDQAGTFKIVIRGSASDVLRANVFIKLHVVESLQRAAAMSSIQLPPQSGDNVFAWIPRGKFGNPELYMSGYLRDIFFGKLNGVRLQEHRPVSPRYPPPTTQEERPSSPSYPPPTTQEERPSSPSYPPPTTQEERPSSAPVNIEDRMWHE